MLAPERRNQIMQILNENKQLLVKDISIELNVSEGTLRNDLKILEEDGLLERTHGGAVLPKPTTSENTFHSRKFSKSSGEEDDRQSCSSLCSKWPMHHSRRQFNLT